MQLALYAPPTHLETAPVPDAQQSLLDQMRAELAGLLEANQLRADFGLQPGVRLRRSFGLCRYHTGRAPVISIRCTDALGAWRPRSAIMLTLLHELAHLKYRSHGPRFWQLHRRLVQQATVAGLYHPGEDDAAEPAQGNTKLAGTAAGARAAAAQQERQARWQQSRQAIAGWQVGDTARVLARRGELAGQTVQLMEVRRTRVIGALPDGRRYSIPAAMLGPV